MSFLEMFAPDLRHLREERERQKHMVAHPKYGGGAPLGIDLEAGTARISVPTRASAATATPGGTDRPAADAVDDPAT
jgi:Family of unknown function (DUF6191)